MARVTGIGGFFFRARDPEALNRWYADHLGVVLLDSHDYGDPCWIQDRGETVISAFALDATMFGRPEQTWMLNFRVDDLDGVVQQLRDAGVTVEPHAEVYPNGRFAELADPEGNPIQLWQPDAASVAPDADPGGSRGPQSIPGADS